MKICLKCNANHDKPGKFCSRSCANSRGIRSVETRTRIGDALRGRVSPRKGQKGHIRSAETREKLSAKLKLAWTDEMRKRHSDIFSGRKLSTETKHKISESKKALYKKFPEKHPNRKCAGRKSFWQQVIFNDLKVLFPDLEQEFLATSGIYLDIALPQVRANIEYDGERWHNKERDMLRDTNLAILGWQVKRISSRDLCFNKRTNYTQILHECKEFLESAIKVSTVLHASFPNLKIEFNSQ